MKSITSPSAQNSGLNTLKTGQKEICTEIVRNQTIRYNFNRLQRELIFVNSMYSPIL